MPPRKPIYSTLEDDADLREEISDFVVRLAEAVDVLQDLHSAGDLAVLALHCREHAEQAMRYGYPEFAEVARSIARSADDGKPESAEDGLLELAEVAQRIRLAHRGAA